MAEWIDINKLSRLTANDTYAINNNFQYLKEQAEEKENAPIVIYDCTMPLDTPINQMVNKFNLVEANIQSIHEILRYSDPEFKEFEWSVDTNLAQNLYDGVNRWVKWLNDIKRYFDGGVLYFLTDRANRYIIDNEGRYILIYKRWENA